MTKSTRRTAEGRLTDETRARSAGARRPAAAERDGDTVPAAGAHASSHLVNQHATPGAGALPSAQHDEGEVDGGAG